jgi:hypothetical protein
MKNSSTKVTKKSTKDIKLGAFEFSSLVVENHTPPDGPVRVEGAISLGY